MTARHFSVICSKSTDLHDHEILVDLCGDGAEQGGELVLTGGYFTVSEGGRGETGGKWHARVGVP